MRLSSVHDPTRVLAVCCGILALACSDSTAPPSPHTIEIVAGDGQGSRPGEELPIPLKVRVVGSDDRPLAGATVQWTITEGIGTLSLAQSTTDASGGAETRLTLGPRTEEGRVGVTATVQGVAPVTFTLFLMNPCYWYAWPEITLGTTIRGMLRPLDCELVDDAGDRWFGDLYPFRLSSHQAIDVRLRSESFDPEVQLHSEAPWYYYWTNPGDPNREVRLKAILPEGWYAVIATSLERSGTGAYQLDVMADSLGDESCEGVLVVLGVATTQRLAPTDCREPPGYNADRFWLFLFLGQRVRVTQASTQFPPKLRVLRSGRVVAESDGSASGTAVLVYTAEDDDIYEVQASSAGADQTGSYTLAVALDIAPTPQISKAQNDALSQRRQLGTRPRGNVGVRFDPLPR